MIIPPYPATHLLCEIYDSIDGNASDYDIRRGSENFQATATPKEPFARRFEQPLDSPATEPSTPARAKTPRLVRQIAQISAGRVDVPCPFENTGHCRSRIFRPHRLAGVLVGAWTDAQHRSDHHSPTHPTYLKVRLRQVFGEDLLLNSVIKSTAVPGARRCRHPVAFATGLGLFAVIGPPFISLLDRAKGDVCEQR